jgi:hypothetical protein
MTLFWNSFLHYELFCIHCQVAVISAGEYYGGTAGADYCLQWQGCEPWFAISGKKIETSSSWRRPVVAMPGRGVIS